MTATRRGKTFQDLCREAKTRINEITADDLKRWLAANKTDEGKDFVLIDVRETDEYARGKIGDAIHISRGILETRIDEVVPDQDKTVVLYCGGGNRSALAADMIQQMGYDHVYSLIGGWRGWNQ